MNFIDQKNVITSKISENCNEKPDYDFYFPIHPVIRNDR